MKRNFKIDPVNFLVFCLALLLLLLYYSDVILSPNAYLFAAEGDGIKNYYTYLYQSKYGESFTTFKGMNYPFYEHHIYTDGQPLLAFLTRVFGWSSFGVGVLNLLMLLSIPLSSLYIFKIFRLYHVSNFWAIPAALSIAFLMPQINRMGGHYALSLGFAIPMFWYLLIKLDSVFYYWKALLTALCPLLFFFIHPYLGMILSLLALTHYAIKWLQKNTPLKQLFFSVFITGAFPFLFFKVFMIITDIHDGRPVNPSGFFDYYGNINVLLTPYSGPLKFIFSSNPKWETHTYLGGFILVLIFCLSLFHIPLIFSYKRIQSITNYQKAAIYLLTVLGLVCIFFWATNTPVIGDLLLIASTVFFTINLWKKNIDDSPFAVFFGVSLWIAVFAFCIPFKYEWGSFLADIISPVKQFRSLGRFLWIVYFGVAFFTVIKFYQLRNQFYKTPIIIFILALFLSAFEIHDLHSNNSDHITKNKNLFLLSENTEDFQDLVRFIKTKNPDALLYLPFYYYSSESIYLTADENTTRNAFLLSYHSNTPIMNTASARLPLKHSEWMHKFFTPPFIEKEILHHIPKSAKIFAVKGKEQANVFEQRVLGHAKMVYQNTSFIVYEISPFALDDKVLRQTILKQADGELMDMGNGWKTDSLKKEQFFSLETSINNAPSLTGTGSVFGIKKKFNILAELSTDTLEQGKYTASFYYHLKTGAPDVLAVSEVVLADGANHWYDYKGVAYSYFVFDDWILVELDLSVNENTEKVKILLSGDNFGRLFLLESLVIRKKDAGNLYKKFNYRGKEYLNYNNFIIPLE